MSRRNRPPIDISVSQVGIENGILVFDNDESFNTTLQKVEKMSTDERKIWEENLRFKSFDRLCREIISNEIAYTEKFESLPAEELQKSIETGDYQPYSQLALKYIENGVVKVITNSAGEEQMDFNKLLNSTLINENGFVVVGNEIRQFTENQYKVIKSRDFRKINNMVKITNSIDNNDFFVSDINKDRFKSLGTHFNFQAESYTTDKQKVTLREYCYSYKTGTYNYRVDYTVYIDNWKKNIFGTFKPQFARTWYSGDFNVTEGRMSETEPYVPVYFTKNYTFSASDVNLESWHYPVYSRAWYAGGSSTSPEWIIPTYPIPSTWSVTRWGGASGLGVRILDHSRWERF